MTQMPAALAAGRRLAEQLMTDACTITRVTGHYTDPDTGVQTPTLFTVYTGKCRVQQRSPAGTRAADVGEAYVLLQATELQLPIAATGIQVADVATIDTSAYDPDLPGRKFRVRELSHKSHLTARRLGVEEVTR